MFILYKCDRSLTYLEFDEAHNSWYASKIVDLFMDNPEVSRLPPDKVRIIETRAEPFPDGRRVRVLLEITPFLKPPDSEISIFDSQGDEVANATIIEAMLPKIVVTLHLRGKKTAGIFKLVSKLYYSQSVLNSSDEEPSPDELIEHILIDQQEISFVIGETSVKGS